MTYSQAQIESLADQLMRDPAIAGPSGEVIPRRPMIDVSGHGFRFGGVERDTADPNRITRVRLISIGAPERTYAMKTHTSDLRAALVDALGRLVRRVQLIDDEM
jgi:hypothetical protein